MPTKTDPYDVGDDAIVYADFENANEVPTTPTDGTLHVQDPAGTESPYAFGTLTNPTAGRLEKKIRVDQAGRWYARFTMIVDGDQIVREFYFQVRETVFSS